MAGDEIGAQEQERSEGTAARGPRQQAAQEPLTPGSAGAAGTGTDYEALLAERDAKIAELEGRLRRRQSPPRRRRRRARTSGAAAAGASGHRGDGPRSRAGAGRAGI